MPNTTNIPFAQIDAFTPAPFKGNPAAVCLLPQEASADWMQSVAAEMNLAETAFLLKAEDGYQLRWFTPVVEMDLCGHATLASSHFLWESGQLPLTETIRFHTRSGLLTATRAGDWIELDFPSRPQQEIALPTDLLATLGIAAESVKYAGYDDNNYLIEVESAEIVRQLQPDMPALKKLANHGVIVTAQSDQPEYDCISRFFAPAIGIDEDPVTGGAHCYLAPYWGGRLGKTELTAYQASPRGGVLRLTTRGSRVGLGGQAITVLRGELLH